MKQTAANSKHRSPLPGVESNNRFRWLGLALVCLAGLNLSACDPSSSDGGIDPGIVEIPIAFIQRPIPVDDQGDPVQADLRDPLLFMAGGDVYLRTNSTSSGALTNITRSVTGGIGDVKGLNASHDGTRLIFSLRLFDPDPNDDIVPSWNIYEYNLTDSSLRRIITNPTSAEEGDDLFPAYLGDGRIVFTSNRQRQSREMLTNEGTGAFSSLDEDEGIMSLVLHVMGPAGSDIHQISFNQSHDLYPQVMTRNFDGQVLFSRWDNAAGNDAIHLYKANPDGSSMEAVYGVNSHFTGTSNSEIHFTDVREMEDGDLMVIARSFTDTFAGGDIYIIDGARFADTDKPIWPLSALPGPGQSDATISNIDTRPNVISVNGRYGSAFPLWDGSDRILVSKSICQVSVNGQPRPCIDPYLSQGQEQSPTYSIWLYDMKDDTEKPLIIADAGMVITNAITVEQRTRPAVIFDKALVGDLDPLWVGEVLGVVNIRSVYDMGDNSFNPCLFNQANACIGAAGITSVMDLADPVNAAAAERPARFVRFLRPVGIPDPDDPNIMNPPDLDNDAFGPSRQLGMRQVVGYAPVEPDGSVKVKVPPNIPLAVEILDAEGRRIGPRHDNWFQVQPGDMLSCNGCHNPNTGGPTPEVHGRADGRAPSINSGLAGASFSNTLIPGLLTPNPYGGAPGQTMAEVRFASTNLAVPPYTQPRLNADLLYTDYWTDPASGAAVNPDITYRYTNLPVVVPSPASPFCAIPNWEFNCRVTINYQAHIHPLWSEPNRGPDVDMNGIGDNTCTECHTTSDAMGNDRVADGQLDLTAGVSDQNADHFKSYRELLFIDQVETIVGVMLQDLQVPDGMGGTTTVNVFPTMTNQGARRSYFIEKMTETELDSPRVLSTVVSDPNYVDHSGFLTGDELKLISEWLDLGAQNFNNPFDPLAPQN